MFFFLYLAYPFPFVVRRTEQKTPVTPFRAFLMPCDDLSRSALRNSTMLPYKNGCSSLLK